MSLELAMSCSTSLYQFSHKSHYDSLVKKIWWQSTRKICRIVKIIHLKILNNLEYYYSFKDDQNFPLTIITMIIIAGFLFEVMNWEVIYNSKGLEGIFLFINT